MLTALAYDKSLSSRYASGLRIGLVSKSGNPASKTRSNEVAESLAQLGHATIQGLHFEPIPVEFTNTEALQQAVTQYRLNVVYLMPDLGSSLASILDVAKRNKLLTITGEGPYMRAGAILGVTVRGDKPKVIVNLAAAQAQGADFDFRLLRLAEVLQ